jgi:hypothetical protein
LIDIRAPFFPEPVYDFTMTTAQWSEILTEWSNLSAILHEQALQARAKKEDEGRAGVESVCIRPWFAMIESNLFGKSEQVFADGCSDPGTYGFVNFLLAKAIEHAPYCAELNSDSFGNDAAKLMRCKRLYGNKLLAAKAMNVASHFDSFDRPPHYNILRPTSELAAYIDPSATLHFAGGKTVRGALVVATEWENAFGSRQLLNLDFNSASGADRRVTIKGTVVALDTSKTPYREFLAPFTQTWQCGENGDFLLSSWEIGEFSEEKDR